jgi:hypothetical protein
MGNPTRHNYQAMLKTRTTAAATTTTTYRKKSMQIMIAFCGDLAYWIIIT